MNVQSKSQVVFFRTETGREPVREWLEKINGIAGGNSMNKYEGRDVDEYLKERGIFEEVNSLTQQELEALRDQDSPEIIETPLSYVGRFLQWLRHAFNV